jgi:hypothetical protein
MDGMPPGPTETTSEQLQNYLELIVDDLIMLYDEGIIITPPEHPDGTLLPQLTYFENQLRPAFRDTGSRRIARHNCRPPRHVQVVRIC